MTASAAGIYGNFGQANYCDGQARPRRASSNTLALEGKKKNVHVNTIAPIAGSRLTETVLPKEIVDALKPRIRQPAGRVACHESCNETGGLFEVGGGFFAKLRWERAEGKTSGSAAPITVEAVQESWTQITGFEKTDAPDRHQRVDGADHGQRPGRPEQGRQRAHRCRCGARLRVPELTQSSYDEQRPRALRAGRRRRADPLDEQELRFVYEMHSRRLRAAADVRRHPGAATALIDDARKGQAGAGAQLRPRPAPPRRAVHRGACARCRPRRSSRTALAGQGHLRQGQERVIDTEAKSYDEDGELSIINEFIDRHPRRGGWGGDRGPSVEVNVPPNRAPDAVVEEKIGENQALLYRLTGDCEPAPCRSEFAKAFGFERPILHGLCTFGYAAATW